MLISFDDFYLLEAEPRMQEGKPILQLPPKNVELVLVDFSEEEREVRLLISSALPY